MKIALRLILVAAAVFIGALTALEAGHQTGSNARGGKGRLTMADKIKRFSPTELTADISKLSANDRNALGKLVEAARLMDCVYLMQEWSGNARLLPSLRADNSPDGEEILHYFNINMVPWSRLDHDEPFVEGVPAIPP